VTSTEATANRRTHRLLCEPVLSGEEYEALEFLDRLPVCLEPTDLDRVRELHRLGKTSRAIGNLVRLDRLVVVLELARVARGVADEQLAESARVTRREWNRLAKGTYVPVAPIRAMLASAIRCRPGLTARAVLKQANVPDFAHAERLLGLAPYPGGKRPSQIIASDRAVLIVRAIGRAPAEVPGL
jgi:hypothetical protein